jgi:predicted transcriptional regulator
MAELNEDLHAQVKAEIEGKEITAAQKAMLFQKYGLLEPLLTDEERGLLNLIDNYRSACRPLTQ